MIGEMDLFAQALRDLGLRETTRLIAITGTNGKTSRYRSAQALPAHPDVMFKIQELKGRD